MAPVPWHRPPEGTIKLNVDGSFKQNTTNGGTGGILRDHLGNWIAGFSCKVKEVNAHHAEILALLHGLSLAKRLNINRFHMETDSQVLINNIKSNTRIYSHNYDDCRSLLNQLEVTSMEHIMREAKSVADLLAIYRRKSKDPRLGQPLVFEASPSFIASSLERDA
ncbi:hypothetical protein MTR67_052731 [Solanum verrucosum]|uniref:RNase H type-1 domain-containing protein n=1 Tax=Solanum verrucosum TaxID=315347 RepID=A0AAF0V9J5_SOLVR|nr:hypothetical protein MTR67_052731 [Solanum verrucosum]